MSKQQRALESARLTLSPLAPRDAGVVLALLREPSVRYALVDDEEVGRPFVRALIEESDEGFARRGVGLCLARARETGALVGLGGFRVFAAPDEVQLLYAVTEGARGQGFAVEMGRALVGYAFEERGVGEICASTEERNAPSLRVLERLGFRRTGMSDGPRGRQLCFALARPAGAPRSTPRPAPV